jgi:vacuolar-type H+-ATPase subunit H
MSGLKKWMGFQGSSSAANTESDNSPSIQTTPIVQKSQPLERIRELESQLAELRSRRDITALSQEEFEILATETAMTLIRTAQQREAKAEASAKRALAEGERVAKELLESAEGKARNTVNQAEVRGRRLIQAAEADAKDLVADALRSSEELIASKRREASSIVTAAKREAEESVTTAISEMYEFRSWLGEVLTEAERLYKVQLQSLDAAESAIAQSRNKLDSAMEKLNSLHGKVEEVLSAPGKPAIKTKEIERTPSSAKSVAMSSAKSSRSNATSKKSPRKNVEKKARTKKSSKKR